MQSYRCWYHPVIDSNRSIEIDLFRVVPYVIERAFEDDHPCASRNLSSQDEEPSRITIINTQPLYSCSSNAHEETQNYYLCPQHKESISMLQWHTERPTTETAVSTSSSTKTAYRSPSSASSKSYKTPTGTVCSKPRKRASNCYKSHLPTAPTSATSPQSSPRGGIHRTACRAGLKAIRWNRVELQVLNLETR